VPQTVLKVLLIEDDPDDAVLVQDMLAESRGPDFDVACAGRLSEGLPMAHAGGFDVVLLDLTLPDGQGLGSLAGVRTAAPDTPVVVLTGMDDQALAIRALQSGAQDYLVKGQDTSSSLARSIRYAVARKHLESVLEQSAQWEQQTWARAQEMLDYRHYVAMSKDVRPVAAAGGEPAGYDAPAALSDEESHLVLADYRALVEEFLQSEGHPEARPLRHLRALAAKLTDACARSKDVVRLQLSLLAEYSKRADPMEYQEFLAESRLVLVELLGAMADRYLMESNATEHIHD
jgi:ActR/RegA family two-component response regulator